MTRQNRYSIAAVVLLSFAATMSGHQAFGQSLKEQLVGTWTLTNLYAVTWDEDDRNPFGAAPELSLIHI